MQLKKNRANISLVRVAHSVRGLNIDLAELCKGSTNDSDSFCLGSNPSSAAIENLGLVPRFFCKERLFCPKIHSSAFVFWGKFTDCKGQNKRAAHRYPLVRRENMKNHEEQNHGVFERFEKLKYNFRGECFSLQLTHRALPFMLYLQEIFRIGHPLQFLL